MINEELLYIEETTLNRKLFLLLKQNYLILNNKDEENELKIRFINYIKNYINKNNSIKSICQFIYKLLIIIKQHEKLINKILKEISLILINEELLNNYNEYDFDFLELLFIIKFYNINIKIIINNYKIYTDYKIKINKLLNKEFDLNIYKNKFNKYSNYNLIYYFFGYSYKNYIYKIIFEENFEDCLFRFDISLNNFDYDFDKEIKYLIENNKYEDIMILFKKIIWIQKIYKTNIKLNLIIENKFIVKNLIHYSEFDLDIFLFTLKYISKNLIKIFIKFSIKRLTRFEYDTNFENFVNNYVYFNFKDLNIFEPLNDINNQFLKDDNVTILRNHYLPSSIYKTNLIETKSIKNKKDYLLSKMNSIKKKSIFRFLDYLSTVEIKYENNVIKWNLYTYYILINISEKKCINFIKNLYKNYDFDHDLLTLLDNNIILKINNNEYIFNENFNKSIDISYIPFSNKIKNKLNETDIISLESKISKILKIKKKINKNDLFLDLNLNNILLFEKVIENWINKDIVKNFNEYLEYIN